MEFYKFLEDTLDKYLKSKIVENQLNVDELLTSNNGIKDWYELKRYFELNGSWIMK